MNKQQVRERLDGILEQFEDDYTFPHNWLGHIDLPRIDQRNHILIDGEAVEMSKSPVYGFEIFELAVSKGIFKSYQKILVEELPNGTSRIIGQHDQIQLRDHMKFSAIGR